MSADDYGRVITSHNSITPKSGSVKLDSILGLLMSLSITLCQVTTMACKLHVGLELMVSSTYGGIFVCDYIYVFMWELMFQVNANFQCRL